MASILDKGPFAKIMKVFGGTKHERDLKRMHPLVDRINEIYAGYESLTDDELKAKTDELRARIAEGEPLEEILPEAFATVKDACRRNVGRTWSVTEHEQAWDMVPYDVQLIGAVALHDGKIAEMATGEGKTLVAIFALYLNALTGRGAHLVTVNDYLARRDSEWVGEILRWLGLTVGCIQNWMRPEERKAQYACDVTYGTNNEFGFDYLRDNMAVRAEHRVQRPHAYAIVDEVDSVLIDEARTPLIISGPVPHSIQQYAEMKPHVEKLVRLQTRLVNDLVAEAQTLLERAEAEKSDDLEYRAGELLLKVSRGAPKHKRLLKLKADEPSVQKLIQRLEADNLREKTMHVVDEELYFAIDEKNHTVNISDMAMTATDRSLFRVPELSERLDWIDRCADVREDEIPERREELLDEVTDRLVQIRGLSGKEREAKHVPVRDVLARFAGEFAAYVESGEQEDSELGLEARTKGLREGAAKELAEVLPLRAEAGADESDDDADVLFDLGWRLDILTTPRTLQERSAKKEAVHRDYAIRSERIHDVQTLMKAYTLYEKDVEYVVQQGKIMIVDSFTGRLMPGRRFSDGLHQALEAKENVKIEGETQTFATITIQNYFRLYDKLAGMTGTAETEASEFWEIYDLDVVVIPTNRPVQRADLDDVIYRTRREKYNAAIDEIERLHKLDLPVLVGTVSVDVSETLSRMLKRKGVKHNVLNAKQHQKEAEIVRHAGRPGAVTIATNMAGRGTDIKLSPEIGQTTTDEHGTPGGLQVVGTERHESRRIDRQLRGRSGRQGDPGATRFFISLEDDLMRKFAQTERIAGWMERMGAEEGEALEHPMLTKSMERAQKRVESWNFDIRKRLLEYDNVMNKQREIIYERRNHALDGGDTKATITELIETYVEDKFHDAVPDGVDLSGMDLKPLIGDIELMFLAQVPEDELEAAIQKHHDDLLELLRKTALRAYAGKEEQYGEEIVREVERHVLLRVIDEKWRDHLYEIDQLKEGVGWASVGGKDPLLQYKKEAYELFARLDDVIRDDTIKLLMRVQVQVGPPEGRPQPPEGQAQHPAAPQSVGGADQSAQRASAAQARARQAQAARTARTLAAVVGPKDRGRGPAPEPVATKPSADRLVGRGAQRSPTEAFPTPAAGGDSSRPARRTTEKVGRNDPCPCGSGKKYKKCCGK